ncbi:unnamed protein product [Paramecium sonneborni]|uniref:PIG-P domain-containing protein n=1 Tax=Paramecium sonneborni TaxID=65129 RepID=A0A8S1Q9A3_9CILI|nr:unnamed protein product [Paramecium sonneborni]
MKSIEIYGFIGWIASYIVFFIYLAWVFLPESALHSLGIHYFPQKYWALAIPSFLVATILAVITGYAALNYCFCNNFNSYENIEDKYTRWHNVKKTELHEGLPEVYDIPINVVNNVLYWQKEMIEKYIPKHQD